MAKALVIVESPAKARTITRFLGPDFLVESSIGHIRDLPSTASEIPAKLKKEPWARLGVNVDQGFVPLYIIPASKRNQVKKLKAQVKKAEVVFLATDEDREGEAIAWHLIEVLKPACPVRRMVFHEITESAIAQAMESTREIDQRLVNAQESRRILDRLVGYEISPVLWRKVRPKLSAGRVQSVATRMVVERERTRMAFVEAGYWGIEAKLQTGSGQVERFAARLTELDGRRIAVGKDFDATTGRLKSDQVKLLGKERAQALVNELTGTDLQVTSLQEKKVTYRPYPPFITSTLQQEAGRKLRFNAQRTMRIAQALYENGYITYMRTDSTTLSGEAIQAARKQVVELYGDSFLPAKPRLFARKSKNAQEAHEAIRPAGESFRTPLSLKGVLESDQLKLYELIWKRTLASQMKDAQGLRTNVRLEAALAEGGPAVFSTSGKVLTFAGFLRAYVEGSDDPGAEMADQEKLLPALKQGDMVNAKELAESSHTTQPAPRYTEAALVKELEARGIGRPSTYATIIQTIQDRGYVWHKGSALVPTFTAFAVIRLLEMHMPDLVDYDFTARMESGLDTIASGEQAPTPWLNSFYFGSADGRENGLEIARVGLKALVSSSDESIDPRQVSRISIGKAEDDEELVVRVGRYGPYLQVGETDKRARVPDDLPPDELTPDKAAELIKTAAQGGRVLGTDAATSKPVYVKNGRFGPYVQLGDPELTDKGKVKRGGKPKMASLWPTMNADSLTLEEAQMLLAFPREVGKHPETGDLITAQDGRYGPYIKMGSESRSLSSHERLATVTLEQSVELFKQPKGRRGSGSSSVLAELGAHPSSGAAVQVKDGRYGAYVTDGVVNATIPKGKDPTAVNLDDAVELISKREDKLRAQGKDPRAPKAKKPARKVKPKKK
jgi:DNA topoisomerase-1